MLYVDHLEANDEHSAQHDQERPANAYPARRDVENEVLHQQDEHNLAAFDDADARSILIILQIKYIQIKYPTNQIILSNIKYITKILKFKKLRNFH